VPFIVMSGAAGNELPHIAAAVILAGLITATLLNTLVLPVACLRFGPAYAPGRDHHLTVPHVVPRPREEPGIPEIPEVPQPTGRPEEPVG
jgi:hypothetical protein